MDTTYNGGMTTGIKPFQQSSTQTGEFMSGINTTVNPGNVRSMQQTNPGSYRPSSVINQFASSPNGQSATTYTRNRELNFYRQ
jgi:hypothetical protein